MYRHIPKSNEQAGTSIPDSMKMRCMHKSLKSIQNPQPTPISIDDYKNMVKIKDECIRDLEAEVKELKSLLHIQKLKTNKFKFQLSCLQHKIEQAPIIRAKDLKVEKHVVSIRIIPKSKQLRAADEISNSSSRKNAQTEVKLAEIRNLTSQ